MKHLTLLFLLGAFCSIGQDSVLRADKKNISIEVNISPLSANPLSMPYLRGRYFLMNKHAIRLGLSVTGRVDNLEEDINSKTFTYNIRPGYEYHFKGTRIISPYTGIELDFAKRESSYTQTNPSVKLTGAINTNGDEQSFSRIGSFLLVGTDVFIIKKLYLGVELGFGITKVKNGDINLNQNGNVSVYRGIDTTSYGPFINRTIRLGFFF